MTTHTSAKKPHLVIVGGGSAGFSAATEAHRLGARVTILNDGLPVGGTCVNVGCVPSKMLLRAAEAHHSAGVNRFEGIEGTSQITDFRALIAQKRRLIESLRKEKYLEVVAPLEGIEIITERGHFVSSRCVETASHRLEADAILIATGVSPEPPPIPGIQDIDYLTNETAFELDHLPESMAIIGGNYVGLEAAQIFSRLGTTVTVIELQSQILPNETAEVAGELARHLVDEGIDLWPNATTTGISEEDGKVVIEVEQAGHIKRLTVDNVMVATGRKPNTDQLGLEDIGISLTHKGFVAVNDYLETTASGVYAAGDVIGGPMFVYTAAYEGKIAARNALGEGPAVAVDYQPLPWVVFTDPQVAGVGYDETQAAELGYQPESTTLPLSEVPRAIAARDTRGAIKLIRDSDTDRLLGGRIVAPEGSELLMELSMAIKAQMTVAELVDTLHPYLTLAEGIRLAALTFSREIKELSCCAG